MAPKLELAFTMRGYMSKENSLNLDAIKGGPSRIIVPITHGTLEGSGLNAKLLSGGGDWILVQPQMRFNSCNILTCIKFSLTRRQIFLILMCVHRRVLQMARVSIYITTGF
jgi:hypothetical protein